MMIPYRSGAWRFDARVQQHLERRTESYIEVVARDPGALCLRNTRPATKARKLLTSQASVSGGTADNDRGTESLAATRTLETSAPDPPRNSNPRAAQISQHRHVAMLVVTATSPNAGYSSACPYGNRSRNRNRNRMNRRHTVGPRRETLSNSQRMYYQPRGNKRPPCSSSSPQAQYSRLGYTAARRRPSGRGTRPGRSRTEVPLTPCLLTVQLVARESGTMP
jgi:hypothetical protein